MGVIRPWTHAPCSDSGTIEGINVTVSTEETTNSSISSLIPPATPTLLPNSTESEEQQLEDEYGDGNMYETSDENEEEASEGTDFDENLDQATTSEVPDEQEDSLPVEPEVTEPRPTADATLLGN